MVVADIKHQKHQERITRHCKYVKNNETIAPAVIIIAIILNNKDIGPILKINKSDINKVVI